MSQVDIAQLWRTIANHAADDRSYLNELDDIGNGNAGDNYQANMQLVAHTLDRELQAGQGDVGRALLTAADTLRSQDAAQPRRSTRRAWRMPVGACWAAAVSAPAIFYRCWKAC